MCYYFTARHFHFLFYTPLRGSAREEGCDRFSESLAVIGAEISVFEVENSSESSGQLTTLQANRVLQTSKATGKHANILALFKEMSVFC